MSRWTEAICLNSSRRVAFGRRPGNHWMFQKAAVIELLGERPNEESVRDGEGDGLVCAQSVTAKTVGMTQRTRLSRTLRFIRSANALVGRMRI